MIYFIKNKFKKRKIQKKKKYNSINNKNTIFSFFIT